MFLFGCGCGLLTVPISRLTALWLIYWRLIQPVAIRHLLSAMLPPRRACWLFYPALFMLSSNWNHLFSSFFLQKHQVLFSGHWYHFVFLSVLILKNRAGYRPIRWRMRETSTPRLPESYVSKSSSLRGVTPSAIRTGVHAQGYIFSLPHTPCSDDCRLHTSKRMGPRVK